MVDLNIPWEGMKRAEGSFNKAASNIARAGLADEGSPEDSVDLSTNAVELLSAQRNYEANLKAAKAGDEMQGRLLDILV